MKDSPRQLSDNTGEGLPVRSRARRFQSGFTLLELIITLTIVAILAAGTVPVARNMIKRQRELELRRSLREIRKAIDTYKAACENGQVGPLDRKVDDECYPPNLEILIEGIHPPNKANTTIRFLRRMPIDPFTGKDDWGMRSVQDDPGSSSWGGQNVFDVFSKATGTALDGKTQYKDW
ncbi:MAG: type II secretion system protein [Acidobacteria bacterium]|nr:type II secretion system protein [Acidobacteriota bacterium]